MVKTKGQRPGVAGFGFVSSFLLNACQVCRHRRKGHSVTIGDLRRSLATNAPRKAAAFSRLFNARQSRRAKWRRVSFGPFS